MPHSEKCATIIYNSGARSKEEECFAGEAEPVGRCNGGIAMLYSPIICEECPKGRMRSRGIGIQAARPDTVREV